MNFGTKTLQFYYKLPSCSSTCAYATDVIDPIPITIIEVKSLRMKRSRWITTARNMHPDFAFPLAMTFLSR
jgi:hypothetical protein